MKKTLTLVLLFVVFTLSAQPYDCFGIIAGCKATADGSVMMAHNEDDGGEQMLNIYCMPRRGSDARYLWFEFPGMEVADSFINEFGVCIASDSCPSKEDKADVDAASVLYQIRVSVAKKAHSSREAVAIIGSLVEKYGYRGSGRTYLVADPKEGWIVSIVNGRHWVAQRVPDDKVMTIPNYYVIEDVNLSDKANYAGSADIIEYAVARGWYNPATDGKFNFRKAYCSDKSFASDHNILRHRGAYNLLFGRDKKESEPIAHKPLKPITVEMLMDVLSLPLIDNKGTVHSAVFQLRSWLPADQGCIAWTAMGHPGVHVFVPWYLGTTATPKNFGRYSDPVEAESKHFTDTKGKRDKWPDHFYWKYVDDVKTLKARDSRAQKKAFKAAERFDKAAAKAKSGKIDYNAFTASFYE